MASLSIPIWILSTFLFHLATTAQLPPIYWNSSSEMFIGDVDRVLTVKIMDTLDIHCPFYNDTVTRDEAEYSIIYSVSEKGYNDCELDASKPFGIGTCASPFGKESILKLVFRDFTPNPNAIEYKAGQTYYFISTSDGTESGLRNRKGGLCLKSCKRRGLRLKIKVEPRDGEEMVNKVESKNSVASTVGHEKSTEDPHSGPAISNSDGNILYAAGGATSAKQYATGRRQLTSDTTISGVPTERESGNEESDVGDSVAVKFMDGDNNLRPTPGAVSAKSSQLAQMDDGTDSLTYDPYGLDAGSNSVKRDRQSSESWRGAKGRPGRYQSSQDTSIILYEIHEMEPQRINRYDASSSSSRTSFYWVVLLFVLSLTMVRWRYAL